MDIILNVIVLTLLVFGIILIIYSWTTSSEKICPPPQIIYKTIPENILDQQYGSENKPSEIYLDMFKKSSPWIGGFTIGNKGFVSDKKV